MVQVLGYPFSLFVSPCIDLITAKISGLKHQAHRAQSIAELALQPSAVSFSTVRVRTLVAMPQNFADCLNGLSEFFGKQCEAFAFGWREFIDSTLIDNPIDQRWVFAIGR
jgi:hypothetical protein